MLFPLYIPKMTQIFLLSFHLPYVCLDWFPLTTDWCNSTNGETSLTRIMILICIHWDWFSTPAADTSVSQAKVPKWHPYHGWQTKYRYHWICRECVKITCWQAGTNPREGTPILGHGREVPRWWPPFLRFPSGWILILCLIKIWLTLFLQKKSVGLYHI